jgi:hypothetical protein
MPYIGNSPTPVPLQSSQLAENITMSQLAVTGSVTVGGVLAANSGLTVAGGNVAAAASIVTGALFTSISGNGVVPNGTPTQVATLPSEFGVYLVSVYSSGPNLPNGASAFAETALISVLRSGSGPSDWNFRVDILSNATSLDITAAVSGVTSLAVRATQTSGVSLLAFYRILRIG